jgi:cytochrome P450
MLRLLNRVGPLRGFMTIREEIDRALFELIAERRREAGDRDEILSMLLDARHEDGSEMTAQELRDELMTLLVAGHETTASTLAWAFEVLSRTPRVLAALTEEIRGGEDERYLTATIQETLRHRPVLPNTAPRMVKQPIEVGGWLYPTGASLVANAYLLHHDADLYPDPYAFRPERFLDEPPGTYTWIPFGGGRRRCLGASFAMLEMKVVITSILRAFDLQVTAGQHEPPRRRNITVRPARGSRAQLVRQPAEVEVAA